MPCRRCSVCDGMTHHWLEEVEDREDPTYTHGCKHCDAVGFECDWCGGSGLADEEDDDETLCDLCQGEGVMFVKELAQCAGCDARLQVAPQEIDLYCAQCATALFEQHERRDEQEDGA